MGTALLLGAWLARAKRYRQHAWSQSVIVLLNLVVITVMMAPSFRKVGSRKFGGNPRKHLHAKRGSHHHCDHDEIQEHDDGLRPRVLAVTLCPRKPGTREKGCSHGDFQQQNDVGRKRGVRSQETTVHKFTPTHEGEAL